MRKADLIGKGSWHVVDPNEPNVSRSSSSQEFYNKNVLPWDLLKLLDDIIPGKAYRCEWREWAKVGRRIECVPTWTVTVTA